MFLPADVEEDTVPEYDGVMRCALHPETETGLSCGKCGKPICPRCLVHTPVGARCRPCANIRPDPVYYVSAPFYARAMAAGAGLAVAGGIAWAILRGVPFMSFFASIGIGIAIGEGISRSANRKRGRGLQAIAAASVIASFVIGKVFRGAVIHGLSGEVLWRWVFSLDVFLLLFLVVGVMYAVARLR